MQDNPSQSDEPLLDLLARQEAERVSRQLDWDRIIKDYPPPQEWFDQEEPKPF